LVGGHPGGGASHGTTDTTVNLALLVTGASCSCHLTPKNGCREFPKSYICLVL